MKSCILILLLVLVFIFACNNKKSNHPHREMLYGWYNQNDSLINPGLFRLKVYTNGNSDSILVLSSDTIFCSYKQRVDSSGIYRFCNGEKIKTHSFQDTLITAYCKSAPPFLNENVSYRQKKIYSIEKKEFVVYHFIENTGIHTGYDSYYLDQIGPICYYSFDRNEYIFCDSIIGYDVAASELKQVKKALLFDTSFFARYVLNKLMPNYYRKPASYNRF